MTDNILPNDFVSVMHNHPYWEKSKEILEEIDCWEKVCGIILRNWEIIQDKLRVYLKQAILSVLLGKKISTEDSISLLLFAHSLEALEKHYALPISNQ